MKTITSKTQRSYVFARGTLLSFMVLLVGTAIGPLPAASAELTCAFTQITDTTFGGSSTPAISGDGTKIAFRSFNNLTGGNADSSQELFFFDATTNAFTQITNNTGGSYAQLSINADGTRLAFTSSDDLTGGNADHNPEIFLFDATTSSFTQITDTIHPSWTEDPSINADGTKIAFRSAANLTGGNADGNDEIFVFDVTAGTFTQITNTIGGGSTSDPSISADGTRLALMSTRDLTGGNADGSPEIFLIDTTANTFTQITGTPGFILSFQPAINADGTKIAFLSAADLTGGNADGSLEIFLVDTTTNTFTQVTDTTTGISTQLEVRINADGTKIPFYSRDDLTGGNADGNNEVFLFDKTSGITQITNNIGGFASNPSISADGTRIAFNSNVNLTGGNPDRNIEIFVTGCTLPNQPPTAGAGGPYTVDEGGTVGLAGSGTDPDSDPLTFAWDLDNDGTFETSGQNPAFSAGDGPSAHIVTLQVCDPLGLCNTDPATVTVNNIVPTVNAGPDHQIFSGEIVTKNITFSDPGLNDGPWSYSIDWDDETSDNGSTDDQSVPITASHPYFELGDYTVEVCVTDKDGGEGCDTQVVTVNPIPVAIDIKPGSDPNSINCNNQNGVITVAILTTDDFDATTVDHTSVSFEGASETHVDRQSGLPRRHEEDVDSDGDIDLVLHFRLKDTGLSCASIEGILIGKTFNGVAIEGIDAIRMHE